MHQHLPAARTAMTPHRLLLAVCVLLSAPSVNAEPANCGPAMYKICCRGFYINTHRDPADSSGLDACITCPVNYFCDGGAANPIPCKASSCPTGTYTTGCDEFLTPICQACPSCPSGTWNSGCGGSTPGTCTKCNACPKGSSLLAACSALADTKCTGIACTTQNTSVCEELFCNTNVESNVGRCALCPTGWLASGLACTPCPKGQSCNEKGVPLCGGDCSAKFYPRCELESNFVECLPCTESLPNNSVSTRGGVLDRPDACSTYITCNTGYVLTYNQNDVLDQFNLTCTPCLVAEAGTPTFLSNGLTPGDPYSCLYDLAVGAKQQNASTNSIGYWGNYSNTCPDGMSSSAGQAPDASFCVTCPSFTPYAADPTWWTYNCEFICLAKYNKIGQSCIPTIVPACGPGTVTVSTIPEVTCRSTPLPWNSPGYATLSDAYGTVVVSVVESTYQQTAAALAFDPRTRVFANGTAICTAGTSCTSTNGYTPYLVVSYQLSNNATNVYVFLSREYGRTNRHRLWKVSTAQNKITLTKEWALPTRVCNSAVGVDSSGNEYVYMSLCSTSFVSFVNASDVNATSWNSTRTGRVSVARYVALLIGSVKGSGSRDGLRDEALFESALSLAVAPMGPETKQGRLFVLDQTACRMAEVRVVTPGSFLTSALTVATGCQTGSAPIPSPYLLSTVLNGALLLFLTDDGLYQFDTALYSLQLVIRGEILPAGVKWVNVTTPSKAYLGGNVIQLWVASATSVGSATNNSFLQLFPTQTTCPNGSTSLLGSGVCTPCASTEFSAPEAGLLTCTPCNPSLACPLGQFLSPCTSGADATCVPCEQYPGVELIQSHAATEKHTWSATGVCHPIYRYPCPSGYWGSNLCTQCPENTYTSATSPATSQAACICLHCGYYEAGKCVIPSPFALVNKTVSPTCDEVERDKLFNGDTSWTDYSGCADLLNQAKCSKTCSKESTTCTECGANGLYLERFAPKVCKECPDGKWGSNGLSCTDCPPLRVSASNHTFCMCGFGTVFKPPEDCVCPAGHEVRTNSKACTPCLPNFYMRDALVISKTDTNSESLCVECSAGYEALNLGSTACTPCKTGWYRTPTRPKCILCEVPGQYATDPTDHLSCTDCDTSCQPGMRATKCPTRSDDPKYLRCVPCESPTAQYPKLQADAWEWVPDVTYTYQESKLECRWQCKNSDRFFLNEDMECVPCAEDSCEPGTVFVPCTATRNGYCTQCSNASMPTQNAMWDPEHPCEWLCKQGYLVVQKTYGSWTEYACVKGRKLSSPWWAQVGPP